jgi:hypothetical protein
VLPGLALGGAEADPTVVVQEVLKMGVQQSRLKEQVHAPYCVLHLCVLQWPFLWFDYMQQDDSLAGCLGHHIHNVLL